MCGRYALYGPVSRLREVFEAAPEGFEFEPRWNAAPMQWLPVVRQRPTGERVIHRLRWGLVPSWGCKLEPQKFPSADQQGLSRARSMRSCIACMTSSWV